MRSVRSECRCDRSPCQTKTARWPARGDGLQASVHDAHPAPTYRRVTPYKPPSVSRPWLVHSANGYEQRAAGGPRSAAHVAAEVPPPQGDESRSEVGRLTKGHWICATVAVRGRARGDHTERNHLSLCLQTEGAHLIVVSDDEFVDGRHRVENLQRRSSVGAGNST